MIMLKVFISHSHEEKAIALAWQKLLDHVSQGAIEVWLSSDTKPTGGMKIGTEWRENIYNKLSEADYILAIVSPRSVDRPWILWECGLASGTDKERGIIPIIYSMPLSDFEGPLSTYQAYSGEDRNKILEICERLMTEASLSPRPEYWDRIINNYFSTIKLHRPPRNAGAQAISVWSRRIENHLNSGRSSELAALMETMYSSLGENKAIDPQIHELSSLIFLDDKRFDLALDETNKALYFLPDDIALLHRKGLIYLEMSEHLKAKEHLDYIYREFPDAKYFPEIAGLEGRLHRELYELTGSEQELAASISAYEAAFTEDPLSYYCGVNVVSLKLINGEMEEAREMAKKVLETCEYLLNNNERVSFWVDFTIGDLYLVLKDYGTAHEAYTRAMSRNSLPSKRNKESALKGIERLISFGVIEQERLVEIIQLLS
jgi:tetratricopeptide (TPR) repeat protein